MDHDQELVTVFGGAGFVGTQIVQLLAQRGHLIRVAVRRPDLAGHLRPLGAVGQIAPIQANVRSRESVEHAVCGATIVINLVGIGFERGNQNFGAIHVAGARHVAEQVYVGLAQPLRAPDELDVAEEVAVLGLVRVGVRVPPAAVGPPALGAGRLAPLVGRRVLVRRRVFVGRRPTVCQAHSSVTRPSPLAGLAAWPAPLIAGPSLGMNTPTRYACGVA